MTLAAWGLPWNHLGALLGRLGGLWGRLEAIMCCLAALFGHLWALFERLGALLGPSWAVLGPSVLRQSHATSPGGHAARVKRPDPWRPGPLKEFSNCQRRELEGT